MSGATIVQSAGGRAPPGTVRVWDPFVRIFHWSLVALVAFALATGDEVEWLHVWAGYAIAALVGLRILWGFVGSKHARFADFVNPPFQIARFLRESLQLKASRYLGHNPAGGAMILAMLVLIAFISVTGFMLITDAYWGSEAVKGVHEASAYTLVALVFVHVAGVILASVEHGENLVRAMITGRKRA
ncbi:MAG TPA: cytochrome b/b6 domain-containing protein [Roseiarcus sp.]|nr:cytochrome b/b6 domain-containing protein [Roseiarcus sp.]